ncbi:amidohydrolase [Paenibacillus sp. UNCCL117]|uniref:amidohydrolase n=1 Tax=unclassified Paenibacillus TaxID=185978 RepID=UPI000882F464|nr:MULTISPECIES: amidohydrolase [unclassified Paenibacillus]SDD05196.1 amidohydrolase [Paenibacillus sp. cl123]SFW31925.1 amidohydrolase [Paenibacillus sp. UNCCL117]
MAWLHAHREELKTTYSELHALAEPSWQEYKTTQFLQRAVEEIGIEYEGFPTHTGLIAHWRGSRESAGEGQGNGSVIALRADIDALWQQVDGVTKANHSCGHDAHMTMVLYALKALRAIGFQPAGELRVLFQPAEEVGSGALKLIEAGCLEQVDYLLGIHLRPVKELAYGQVSSAIYHGACAVLKGSVAGRQAHAARPDDGVNAIEAMAGLIQAVRAISIDFADARASCKVTKLHVPNESSNIIPDYASFAIDVRAQTNETMDALIPALMAAVHSAAHANGGTAELQLTSRTVAARPDPELEALVGDVILELLGDAGRAQPPVTPGGEDFHFYPLHKPKLHATMIGLGCGLLPGLHHPQMQFNLDALELGAAILALSVVRINAVRT